LHPRPVILRLRGGDRRQQSSCKRLLETFHTQGASGACLQRQRGNATQITPHPTGRRAEGSHRWVPQCRCRSPGRLRKQNSRVARGGERGTVRDCGTKKRPQGHQISKSTAPPRSATGGKVENRLGRSLSRSKGTPGGRRRAKGGIAPEEYATRRLQKAHLPIWQEGGPAPGGRKGRSEGSRSRGTENRGPQNRMARRPRIVLVVPFCIDCPGIALQFLGDHMYVINLTSKFELCALLIRKKVSGRR